MRSKIPEAVYHSTSKESACKIIEFGFDKHLSGQGCIRRHKADRSSRINDDGFVEYLETIPENRVINTCINPEKFRDTDILLEIKLKHDTKLLDADSVDEIKKVKWYKMLSYARQRGYDGILTRDIVLLFSNKKIERMERIADTELQNIFSSKASCGQLSQKKFN